MTTTEPTIAAVGAVVSKNPLTTVSADMRNNDIVVIIDGEVTRFHQSTFKALLVLADMPSDIRRFMSLAQKPETLMTCWRCDRRGQKEFFVSSHGGDCTVCYMENHCDACSEYLHA